MIRFRRQIYLRQIKKTKIYLAHLYKIEKYLSGVFYKGYFHSYQVPIDQLDQVSVSFKY